MEISIFDKSNRWRSCKKESNSLSSSQLRLLLLLSSMEILLKQTNFVSIRKYTA
jgi:hypothetical protein